MAEQAVSNEQIARMELTLAELARRGNPIAIGIGKNLENMTPAGRRGQLLGWYKQLFEALFCLHLALQPTDRTIEEIRADLSRM